MKALQRWARLPGAVARDVLDDTARRVGLPGPGSRPRGLFPWRRRGR